MVLEVKVFWNIVITSILVPISGSSISKIENLVALMNNMVFLNFDLTILFIAALLEVQKSKVFSRRLFP